MQNRTLRTIGTILSVLEIFSFSGCAKTTIPFQDSSIGDSESFTSYPLLSQEEYAKRRDELSTFIDEQWGKLQDLCKEKPLVFPDNWTDDLSSLSDPLTDEDIRMVSLPPSEQKNLLTHVEAEADIHMAFRLLREGYAAYDYFGGEPVFSRLEKEAAAFLPEDTVTKEDLLSALLTISETITDSNLTFDGRAAVSPTRQTRSYYVPQIFLDKPPENAENWFQRTIDETGRLSYCPAASVTNPDTLPESVLIDGKTVSLQWQEMSPSENDEAVIAVSTLADSTDILASRTMKSTDEKSSVQLDALSRVGGDYRTKQLLIWDLRGCTGGSDKFFRGWFAGFAGNEPDVRVAYAAKITELNKYLLDFVLSPGWYVDSSAGTSIKRKEIVFLLQDSCTAGTGENILNELSLLYGAIRVGAATQGAYLTGNQVSAYLPHSGLTISWGTKLQQVWTLNNPDGIGISPNLWVPPEEALARVEKMIEYYRLGASNLCE